jgi:predicted metal-dependent phosphoesterase TrpH
MIDLHTHTSFSDGTDSPTVLMAKARGTGITTLGVTDHDTTAGWQEAIANQPHGLNLVLGSEISALTTDNISVHILALMFDPTHEGLYSLFSNTQTSRIKRMNLIIEKLNEAGFEITIDEVMNELAEGATLGRPHLADAMVKKGIFKSREEAFASTLSNSSPYYVSHPAPTPVEVVKIIKDAGGVSILAHPLASLRGRTLELDSIDHLIENGLNGVEVDHRDHSEEERRVIREYLSPYSSSTNKCVALCGSSDYHGNGKLNQLGENTTTPQEWEWLYEKSFSICGERRMVQR